MAKAKILVLDKVGKRTVKEIAVLFNPSEYTIVNNAKLPKKEVLGVNADNTQFISKGSETLTIELFFDTYTMREEKDKKYKDVREYTKQIKDLQKIVSEDHRPPICAFSWGSLHFKSMVQSVTERFTMFSNGGVPLRARLTVVFSKVEIVTEALKENSLESADRTKSRTLKDGEHLWNLANNEYDDSSNWRPIANANNIDNPRKIKPGTHLIVPSLE